MTAPRPFSASLKILGRLARGRLPGQVVIQYTDRCNAACAQCGMRRDNDMPRTAMEPDAARRMLDALAARGVAAVSFTGGEPLLCLDEICALARHARAAGISHVRTGTNGFLFTGSDRPSFERRVHTLAEKLLAAGFSTFWISLDSAGTEAHERNRGLPGVVAGIERALPIFHEHGLYPSVNLGINRLTGGGEPLPHLEDAGREAFFEATRLAFSRFYMRAEELGFTIANACYPMSREEGGAVYQASSAADMISFSRAEKRELFAALADAVPQHRHRMRIFTPVSSLMALIRDLDAAAPGTAPLSAPFSAPCRGGIDFFYVDCADMQAYPCGYRGDEPLGPAKALDPRRVRDKAFCRRCEWECFRDPSELAAPLLSLFSAPFSLAARFASDRAFARAWLGDLTYYRACGWFDARRPPDSAALARFAPQAGRPHA
ncbi:Radical SAM domain protein [Desulfovibrio sp. X2]|uniref:radical SAM protein n=1 Tax=Desulfovibrio sp. X2 TaxID=941449 RepID=UPI0003588B3C|nr:radical SAM protein [Desulfovibrio sp. X2]EPR44379.1 Radical SAM domain protein [Desulfovibrio sp. X2]